MGILVSYLITGDTPDPEHAPWLPAVWDKDTDGGVAQVIRLRENKDLV